MPRNYHHRPTCPFFISFFVASLFQIGLALPGGLPVVVRLRPDADAPWVPARTAPNAEGGIALLGQNASGVAVVSRPASLRRWEDFVCSVVNWPDGSREGFCFEIAELELEGRRDGQAGAPGDGGDDPGRGDEEKERGTQIALSGPAGEAYSGQSVTIHGAEQGAIRHLGVK